VMAAAVAAVRENLYIFPALERSHAEGTSPLSFSRSRSLVIQAPLCFDGRAK
jgi:hypothetical protein